MGDDFDEDLFRAARVAHEEPVGAELIVDGELVPSVAEVDPTFRDPVSYYAGDGGSAKRGDVLAELLPQDLLWQLRELTRSIAGSQVE